MRRKAIKEGELYTAYVRICSADRYRTGLHNRSVIAVLDKIENFTSDENSNDRPHVKYLFHDVATGESFIRYSLAGVDPYTGPPVEIKPALPIRSVEIQTEPCSNSVKPSQPRISLPIFQTPEQDALAKDDIQSDELWASLLKAEIARLQKLQTEGGAK